MQEAFQKEISPPPNPLYFSKDLQGKNPQVKGISIWQHQVIGMRQCRITKLLKAFLPGPKETGISNVFI